MVITAARPLPLAPSLTGSPASEAVPPFRVPACHFMVALGWLAFGSVALVLVAPSLAQGAWLSPEVAATVHAFTLGWLVTCAYGALYQLAPVVLGVQPRNPRMAWVVLFLHTLGTGLLVAGLGVWRPPLIGAGWALVAGSLGLWSWNFSGLLRRTPRAPGIGAQVAMAYVAFWLTLALAAVRIGNALGWWLVARGPLVAAHVQLAAVGFGVLLVMGLGSRLFPMFLMNRSETAWPSRWCGPLTATGVVTQVLGWLGALDPMVTVGGLLMAAGVALFLYQATVWVGARARRALDYPLQQLVAAFVLLGAAVVVGLAALRWPLPRLIGAYGVLLIVGWITLVIGAVLGRVLPFLTWLERYGPKMGVRGAGAMPKAADLLPRWSTRLSSGAWIAGTVILAGAVALGLPRVAAAGAIVFTLGSIVALQQYVRLVIPALTNRSS